MKFRINRASDDRSQPLVAAVKEGSVWIIEINTLEELMAISCDVKEGVIVYNNIPEGELPAIIIYDDYLE